MKKIQKVKKKVGRKKKKKYTKNKRTVFVDNENQGT